MTLLFIPSLMEGNIDAFLTKVAVVVLLWLIVIAASMIDLITGIAASKRTGIQHTTSWGLRRTVSKDLQYLALLAMLLIIDIGLSALSQQLPLFSMPLLSTLGVITISVVEAISVAENTRKGKAPEDDKMDDIQQLVMAVADKLGKDKTKAFLQALEDYEKGKKA
ncbi:MAG: phage holin family protein [Paludibacteraceae bacterium]|nr:phage holin family protein [Paludibacteraceae bacterium]